ncbi:amidohydrolase family protein [Cerasicoccus fimbriatus]|uniref:amidohydrolase family protein n=1 Tax=Cerasicoccus fimbriatus TaxID=3014554 RepID=UPI0022B549A9|nr:amidohydrolase family protein [Cerasicoccus sp. TK19100]
MTERSGRINDCVVLSGPELEPFLCSSFEYEDGRITRMDIRGKAPQPIGKRPVIAPAFVNGHTHVGDCFLADAATRLTLAEAFFRPNGFKYQSLATVPRNEHLDAMKGYLQAMAASGTIAHFDFREQGLEGCRRLRETAQAVGVHSVILSQFDGVPFSAEQLEKNQEPLPDTFIAELHEILQESDGFSESTMNDQTDTAWQTIASICTEANKAKTIHCLEDASYRDTSLARTELGDLQRAIEILQPDLIVHLTVANDEEIARIVSANIPVAINPRANATLGLPLPPVAKLLQAGVPLLLGTDNAMLNGANLMAELDFTYKLARSQFGNQNQIDPTVTLKMVTSNVALTRWGSELPGELSVGLPASFVEFDFSSPTLRTSHHCAATIVTRCQPADIRQTVRNGHTIHQRKA